jgi:hypothetical protein
MPDTPTPHNPCFRISWTDALVLFLATIATWFIWRLPEGIGWLPAFVVLHFFLFCNVFRVRRKYELTWAGIFLANTTLTAFVLAKSFWLAFALQLPVSVFFIGWEIAQPTYHGIFARKKTTPI